MSGWWVACCGEVFGDEDPDVAGAWWWCTKYECGQFGEWREYEWMADADLEAHHASCGYWHDPDGEG